MPQENVVEFVTEQELLEALQRLLGDVEGLHTVETFAGGVPTWAMDTEACLPGRTYAELEVTTFTHLADHAGPQAARLWTVETQVWTPWWPGPFPYGIEERNSAELLRNLTDRITRKLITNKRLVGWFSDPRRSIQNVRLPDKTKNGWEMFVGNGEGGPREVFCHHVILSVQVEGRFYYTPERR